MARHRLRRGCLVGNLGQEIGSSTVPAVAAGRPRGLAAARGALPRRAKELGELRGDVDLPGLPRPSGSAGKGR
ncbi:MAG: hypothetical protein U5L11_14080 [Arhodomonas sp.]|nr:hypothetical protein [Arhodomonas sp.]